MSGDSQTETLSSVQQGGQDGQSGTRPDLTSLPLQGSACFHAAVHPVCAPPHLEFSTQAWAPWTESDEQVLGKVQMKAVAMVSGLAGREYKGRLVELGLLSLKERRHQADMCLMHKIMHGIGGLNHEN